MPQLRFVGGPVFRGDAEMRSYWRWWGDQVYWVNDGFAVEGTGITTTAAPVEGDVVSVELVGPSMTFRLNGVVVGTLVDSRGLTNTRYGMRGPGGFSEWGFTGVSTTDFVVEVSVHAAASVHAALSVANRRKLVPVPDGRGIHYKRPLTSM